MTEVLDISVIERDKTILILFICYHLYLKILFDCKDVMFEVK